MESRRSFLKTASLAPAIAYFPWSTPLFANTSANDRPLVGQIGCGGITKWDGPGHAKHGDVVAVCDVDTDRIEWAKNHEEIGKGKADTYTDYRKLLERQDIDVIGVSTTDHWHVKIAIEALEAGKHVFCQKPLTLTLEENKLIRRACEKHADKIFCVGTQQRSYKTLFQRAVNIVQQGLLGDIRRVVVGIHASPVGGPFPIAKVPKSLDWDMWLGQAPKVEYRKQRGHYSFRWWYEYSGGKFTDWGAHHIDIALMAMGKDQPGQGPVEFDGTDAKHPVELKDGMPTRDDSFNTSHDFAIKCTFADGVEMIVDSRSDNGIKFEGTKGRIFVNRDKIVGKPIEEEWDKDVFTNEALVKMNKGKPQEEHKRNFYRCIREGGLPMSDVFTHLEAMNACHMTAIAARLGRKIAWDPTSEKILNDSVAQQFYSRQRRKGFDILSV